MAIKWIGSPNKDKGREGYRPEAIVIHIMEGTLKGTDAWFSNEESGEHLVVPRIVRNSPMHVMFESWGPRSHEVILGVTDKRSNERRTETVTLIPHK